VKYELGFYIPEDGILHSHCRENLRFYTGSVVLRRNRLLVASEVLAGATPALSAPTSAVLEQSESDK
jgi:hypothetical protein